MDEATRKAFMDPHVFDGQIVTVQGREFIPRTPINAGMKGAVWSCIGQYGEARAIRFAIPGDYSTRSPHTEFDRVQRLAKCGQFAQLFEVDDDVKITLYGKRRRFVCFVEELVDGAPLANYLSGQTDEVSSSFLLYFVREMCTALGALKRVGLNHDDLHAGNILVVPPVEGALEPSPTIKIIDMGSLRPVGSPAPERAPDGSWIPKTDHRWFVEHITSILNRLPRGNALVRRDRRFVRDCIGILNAMLDDEPGRGLTTPTEIWGQFKAAYSRSAEPMRRSGPALWDPFEYISAEFMADDALLLKVFTPVPWVSRVSGRNPVIVTGPRGCGKSTIFRWMSLRPHLARPYQEDQPLPDIEPFKITGFYISCGLELQNRFEWISTRHLAQKYAAGIQHYLNLLLAREVTLTLLLLSQRQSLAKKYGLSGLQEDEFCGWLFRNLDVKRPLFSGISRFRQAADAIEEEMFDCHSAMRKGELPRANSGVVFLESMTRELVGILPELRDRKITFLLDDYSLHRVSDHVQEVLYPIIWTRADSHIFKISSEKFGVYKSDASGHTSELGREFPEEVDAGTAFLELRGSGVGTDEDEPVNNSPGYRFTRDLLSHRLKAAGYIGTAEQLIGHSKWPAGGLAMALKVGSGKRNDQYHGLECISDLCSGDVATVLLVFRRIFEMGRVVKSTTTQVPAVNQHQAIVTVSRTMLESVRNYHPSGEEMYSTLNAFGNLVGRILRDGDLIGVGDHPPQATQCPRIEVDRAGALSKSLNSRQRDLMHELARRSIFLELDPGRSRRAGVTTLRWQLRRIYLPAFGAALRKNDAIKLSPQNFRFFLDDAEHFCDRVWSRRGRTSRAGPRSYRRRGQEQFRPKLRQVRLG